MPDKVSKKKRSEIMSRNRSRGNKSTELALAVLLRQRRITGWRRHQLVFGHRPDFVFRKSRLALFVDGCFWHGCPKHYRKPSSNQPYWGSKVLRNKRRDQRVNRVFQREGWTVVRIWEHELHPPDGAAEYMLNRIQQCLGNRILLNKNMRASEQTASHGRETRRGSRAGEP